MKEHFEQVNFDNRFPVHIQNVPLKHFELHWHSYLEIFFTLEGSIMITTNSLSFYLDEGDICFLNSGVIHSVSQTGVNNRVINMKIATTENGPFYKMNRFRFDDTKYLNDLKNNLVPLSSLQQILFYIYYEYKKKLPGYKSMILSLLNALFGIMIRFSYLVPKSDSDFMSDGSLERLNVILQYLDEHYSEKISLQNMAKQLHMNYYYLSHFFKDTAGVSFQEYVNRLRLDKSLTLLVDRGKTITSIALETGFPNTKSYTTAFKAKYGMLPSKYRIDYIEHSPYSGSGILPETIPSEQIGQEFLSAPDDIDRFLKLYFAMRENEPHTEALPDSILDENSAARSTESQISYIDLHFDSNVVSMKSIQVSKPVLVIDADALTFYSTDILLSLFSAIPFSGYALTQEPIDTPFFGAARQKIETHGLQEVSPVPASESSLRKDLRLLNYTSMQSCCLIHQFIKNRQLPEALSLSLIQLEKSGSPLDIGSLFFTLQGIPTPAYFAYSFLYHLSGRIIKEGANYILLQDNDYFFLLFCDKQITRFLENEQNKELNLSSYFSFLKETAAEQLSFHFPTGKNYRCKLSTLCADHGSIFDAWYSHGAPLKLQPDDIAYYRGIVQPMIKKYDILPGQTLSIEVPPLGCGLAEIHAV